MIGAERDLAKISQAEKAKILKVNGDEYENRKTNLNTVRRAASTFDNIADDQPDGLKKMWLKKVRDDMNGYALYKCPTNDQWRFCMAIDRIEQILDGDDPVEFWPLAGYDLKKAEQSARVHFERVKNWHIENGLPLPSPPILLPENKKGIDPRRCLYVAKIFFKHGPRRERGCTKVAAFETFCKKALNFLNQMCRTLPRRPKK